MTTALNYFRCISSILHAPALESDLVADGVSYLLAALLCNSLGDADGADATRLCAEDATGSAAFLAVIEDHLRHLQTTKTEAWNHSDVESSFRAWQTHTFRKRRKGITHTNLCGFAGPGLACDHHH